MILFNQPGNNVGQNSRSQDNQEEHGDSLQTQAHLHCQEAHWPRNLIITRVGLYFVTLTTF